MSVYTAYDMVADCRGEKAEGWLWFSRHFVPPLRVLLRHYSGTEAEVALHGLLGELHRNRLAGLEAAPLRELVVQMRAQILVAAGYGTAACAATLELATLAEALEPLTIIERQVVWLDTMGYDGPESAKLMRMSADTAASVREKAGGLLRARLDDWNITLLRDAGPSLGEAARSTPPEEPVPVQDYINSLDGRVTWQRRTEIERALAASWFEIDHFCRVREVDEAVSRNPPLIDEQAAPYDKMFGVEPPKPGFWKRLIGARA
jgi:hypothetical protein